MIHLLLAVIYMAFISLGLPDALLGSAWPIMQLEFNVPVSYAGIIFSIITVGTIISSLRTDSLVGKFGTGKVTAVSVATTAVALLGFSFSREYWQLFFWAIPYGLGAGSVDACLNNYVALHYKSRHMSWLHCMWGLGASAGPYIMSWCLTGGLPWNMGYRFIGFLQVGLAAVLILSLPLWGRKSVTDSENEEKNSETPALSQIFKIPGAKSAMLLFFCYCALEQTVGLWTSSYLVMHRGMSEELAAQFAGLFYIGITAGRFAAGFLTMKFTDSQMIRIGGGIIGVGIMILLLPFGDSTALAGLLLIGLGCAPIYPCGIHSAPEHFGADKSQTMIGMQVASAYVGILIMPPLFGMIAKYIDAAWMPVYLLVILAMMMTVHEMLCRNCKSS